MSFIPPLPRSELPQRGVADDFVAWPFVDELFDYERFLDSAPAIATLPQSQWGTPVAIVGAGAAGMLAAYELLKIGVRPVVFEASDRIGGRNWTQPFMDGSVPSTAYAEMGAMRVPTQNRVFYRYASEFGLTTGAFPDPGVVPTLLYYENQPFEWQPNEAPPGPFAAIKAAFDGFVGPITAAFQPPWQQGDWDVVRSLWQEQIVRYKDASFYEALVEGIPAWTTEDLNAFGALGMGSGGFGPLYGVGFLELLRILLNQFEVDQQLIVNGIGSLTDGFYETQVTPPNGGQPVSLQQLGAVHLNTPVTAVQYNQLSERAKVIYDGGSQEFAAVIVATTTRAMELMGLTQAAPQDNVNTLVTPPVKTAIRNLHLMESSKLFIRTATKFWLDGSVPQVILTDELPRATYCLDYPQTDNGVVLISYTWGDDSAKLLALPPAQRFAALRETLSFIHPQFAQQLEPVGGAAGILSVDWESEPDYYGAFKLQNPGQDADLQAAYYQFQSVLDGTDRGVYLAGDSVSWAGGWTEGALHTGLNAACAVAKRLGGTLPPQSPLDINPNQYAYARD